MQGYVTAVHEQVADRSKRRLQDLDGYITMRRSTSCMPVRTLYFTTSKRRETVDDPILPQVGYALGEFSMNVDLPDAVCEHPVIRTMQECATDIVWLANVRDLGSNLAPHWR